MIETNEINNPIVTPLNINNALIIVEDYLNNLVQDTEHFESVISTSFANISKDKLINIKQKLEDFDFESQDIPKIQILSTNQLNGAEGAYSTEKNTIYLSSEFVQNSSDEEIAKLVIEELGHNLDAQINTEDSPGDEGAIFAHLVTGNEISDLDLNILKMENDFDYVNIDGESILVEQGLLKKIWGKIKEILGAAWDFIGEVVDAAIDFLGEVQDIIWPSKTEAEIEEYVTNEHNFLEHKIYEDTGKNNEDLAKHLKDNFDYRFDENYSAIIYSHKHGGRNYALKLTNQGPLWGTDASDYHIGSLQDDIMGGWNGDDIILGRHGNDVIYLDQGADIAFGGPDNDLIFAHTNATNVIEKQGLDFHHNRLHGDEGNDTAYGAHGPDFLAGWTGNDSLIGAEGNDSMHGDTGSDTLIAGKGDDHLFVHTDNADVIKLIGEDFSENKAYAEEGNDFLMGAEGRDTLDGGSGDDRTYGKGGNDKIYGKDGDDYVEAGPGDDLVRGDDGNDTLYGNEGNDSMGGHEGNDLIDPGPGEDSVSAGDGYDTVYAFDYQSDTLRGGGDNDIYHVDAYDTVIEYSDDGIDTIYYNGADSLAHLPANVENLRLVDNDPNLPTNGYGNELDNYIRGNGAANYLSGFGGSDKLSGSYGDDLIYGDRQYHYYNGRTYFLSDIGSWHEAQAQAEEIGGHLVVISNIHEEEWLHKTFSKNELLWIGATDQEEEGQWKSVTNEAFNYQNWAEGEPNNVKNVDSSGEHYGVMNWLESGQWNDSNATAPLYRDKRLTGIRGIIEVPSFYKGEPVEEDVVVTFDDTLYGGSGDDTLFGDQGNDYIKGHADDDYLNGGDGVDTLIGGSGNNRLVGGKDADTFVLSSSSSDIISDFNPNEDIIELDLDLGLDSGILAAENFVLGSQASNADHRVIYDRSSGSLFVDFDGVEGEEGVLLANFSSKPVLSHSQFIIS